MNRFLLSLTFSFLLLSISFSQKDFSEAVKQSERIVQKALEENNLPGVAVSVSVNGDLIWSKGFGYSDIENKTPISPSQSKFRIGSVSKPLTAFGLALLYQNQKVNLDAPIQKYVPDFPKKKYDISLRQLAGHTAGIRHYQGAEFMSSKFYPRVKEGLDIFKNDPLLFEPQTQYSYSSYGWNLISAAMEGASKEPFLEYMERAVFKPLDLKNTEADFANKENPNRTKFYHFEDGKLVEAPYVDNSYKWAGGGFLSTAEDLIKFGNAILYGTKLNDKTLTEFLRPQKLKDGKSTNYGIGFRSGEDKKGRVWFGHSGGSVGGTTMWMMFPEQGLVIAVITNKGGAGWKDLPFKISNQFLEVN